MFSYNFLSQYHGSFFTIEKIKKVYSLDSINHLNYIRAKTVVNKYIHKYDQMKHSKIIRPVMPMNMCIINTSKKGAKSYYRILEQNKYNDHKIKVKWNQDFGINIDKKTWNVTFKIAFNTISNNILTWFQVKILYRILGTRKYLTKLGIYNEDICKRCKIEEENLMHMFVGCAEVAKFWQVIENYVADNSGIKIKFTDFTIMFGYHLTDSNKIPINALILVVKKYIYDSSISNTTGNLNLLVLKHRLQEMYSDEKMLSVLNSTENTFKQNWGKLQNVFSHP